MIFLIFVAPLAAKGLVRGDMENELESCAVGNISANSWRLHAPALLLLVLPQKSNMFPDLSASGADSGTNTKKINNNKYHLSSKPTVRATIPPNANSPTIHSLPGQNSI